MISFERALNLVLAAAKPTTPEIVVLDNALNRILAQDIIADIDLPVADVSAMDGFACRSADSGMLLKVVETIPAGYMPRKSIGPGECSRIMTGAVVPQGADKVVMMEHTAEENNLIRIVKKSNASNIRHKAEDVHKGDRVLSCGTRITPAILAVLATAGCATVHAFKKQEVGIMATGDELVEPSQLPASAQIRNSNSSQLLAQTLACGCLAHYYGISADSLSATKAMLEKALDKNDLVLVSGGVSAGDFDFVPEALKACGMEPVFETIAIKPGKPTLFAKGRGKYVFGMPGNPVATFVLFELLVRPFLLKQMGHDHKPVMIRARLSKEITRKKSDRLEFVPIQLLDAGTVCPVEYHGSAHIHAYTFADGMVALPQDVTELLAGSEVDVRLIGH